MVEELGRPKSKQAGLLPGLLGVPVLLSCFLLPRTVQSPNTWGKALRTLRFHLPNPRSIGTQNYGAYAPVSPHITRQPFKITSFNPHTTTYLYNYQLCFIEMETEARTG